MYRCFYAELTKLRRDVSDEGHNICTYVFYAELTKLRRDGSDEGHNICTYVLC